MKQHANYYAIIIIFVTQNVYFSEEAQWCLVDIRQLDELVSKMTCPKYETPSLSFLREEGRYGFCYKLSLSCTTCNATASSTYSSRRTATKLSSSPFIVNELIVLFCNQLGLGHTAMKMFGSLFGWEGLHLKTFQDKESRLISSIIDNTEEVRIASVTKVKGVLSTNGPHLIRSCANYCEL